MLLRMLNGYMEIFSDMLKKAKTDETETSLRELQESVKELKDKYKNEQTVWKYLHDINSIKVRSFIFLNYFCIIFGVYFHCNSLQFPLPCTLVSFTLNNIQKHA